MSAPQNPVLSISQILDQYVRRNFENLDAYFRGQNQLLNFKFFEKVFTGAADSVAIAHDLPQAPLDIIVTHISGPGKVTFQYGQFTGQNLILSATDACRVRFFAGTYAGFATAVTTQSDETQAVSGRAL